MFHGSRKHLLFIIVGTKLTCPDDMKVVLPFGQRTTHVEIGKITTNVDKSKLTSSPDGVLTGTYAFPYGRTVVKLMASNAAGVKDECSFVVDALGMSLFYAHLLVCSFLQDNVG